MDNIQTASETSPNGLTKPLLGLGEGMGGLAEFYFQSGSPAHARSPALCTEQLEQCMESAAIISSTDQRKAQLLQHVNTQGHFTKTAILELTGVDNLPHAGHYNPSLQHQT